MALDGIGLGPAVKGEANLGEGALLPSLIAQLPLGFGPRGRAPGKLTWIGPQMSDFGQNEASWGLRRPV